MRKLFILTIFISSLMISSMAHAEWTRVDLPNETDLQAKLAGYLGEAYYIDLNKIISRRICCEMLSKYRVPYSTMLRDFGGGNQT